MSSFFSDLKKLSADSVVVTVSLPAHALHHAMLFQHLDIGRARVLPSPIGMMDQIGDSSRSQKFRQRFSNCQAEPSQRDFVDGQSPFFRRGKMDRRACPANMGCRPFTFRRSSWMSVVSCPTGRTRMTSTGARRFTSTRS